MAHFILHTELESLSFGDANFLLEKLSNFGDANLKICMCDILFWPMYTYIVMLCRQFNVMKLNSMYDVLFNLHVNYLLLANTKMLWWILDMVTFIGQMPAMGIQRIKKIIAPTFLDFVQALLAWLPTSFLLTIF